MIKIPIYNERLNIVFYNENKEIESKYNIEVYQSTEAFTTRLNNGAILVAFNSDKVNSRVIVHECVHIVNFIFKSKGIDLHLDNDEAQAYLTDYIFELIHKKYFENEIRKAYNAGAKWGADETSEKYYKERFMGKLSI